MARPRDQVRLLLGVQRERRPALLPTLRALVIDAAHPPRELGLEVIEIVKVAAVEEADPQGAEAQLDVRLVVGMSRPAGPWPKQVVRRKRDEARIVDRLWALPP